MTGSLTIVGTGIKSVAQMTVDAATAIRGADKVLYGAGEPMTIRWIVENSRDSECLDTLYVDGKDRMETYDAMADRILGCVMAGLRTCVSFEGHPGVYVHVAHRCIRLAQRAGLPARMLPGISALDCLIADIEIDPAEYGCQAFEATDFLLRRAAPDITSMLILWQVGCIGLSYYSRQRQDRQNIEILTEVLAKSYGPDHEVVVYQAALFGISKPTIARIPLHDLPDQDLGLATLYVPPVREGAINRELLNQFGLAD